MVIKIIISVVIFICALISHVYFRLKQGEYAGRNYMRNEFDIKEEDDDDNNKL